MVLAIIFVDLYNAKGGEPNPEQVEQFLSLLLMADSGDARVQYTLGYWFYRGHIVKRNYKQATEWFRKAAEQGHPEAQVMLGSFYYDGHGVRKDYNLAKEWFGKACDNGLEFACNMYAKVARGKIPYSTK